MAWVTCRLKNDEFIKRADVKEFPIHPTSWTLLEEGQSAAYINPHILVHAYLHMSLHPLGDQTETPWR